jgi:uncharacterized protein
MDLKGKSVLITGANRGIGLALAREFAKHGTHLHLGCRAKTLEVEKDLLALGAQSVRNWQLDLASPVQIDEFCEKLNSQNVKIDVLVNNAGVLTGGLVEKQEVSSFYQMIQVNLLGLMHLTRRLLPGMLERKCGKIVNNASVSAVMYFPCANTYAAAKAGVLAFTRSLEQELKGTGVDTLLMVTPGVKTEMFDQISQVYGDNMELKFLNSIPASEWAAKVVQSVKEDEALCLPTGMSRVFLGLAKHFPSVFERFASSAFHR